MDPTLPHSPIRFRKLAPVAPPPPRKAVKFKVRVIGRFTVTRIDDDPGPTLKKVGDVEVAANSVVYVRTENDLNGTNKMGMSSEAAPIPTPRRSKMGLSAFKTTSIPEVVNDVNENVNSVVKMLEVVTSNDAPIPAQRLSKIVQATISVSQFWENVDKTESNALKKLNNVNVTSGVMAGDNSGYDFA